MAPSRLRGALSPLAADIWTYLPECHSLHRCWAPRCQSLPAVAVRHAVTCACSCSRQKGKDCVGPTSSVWLDAHFSSPACLTPAHCLKCVSGCFAPSCSFHSLCLLKATQNVSPGLNFHLSDTFSYSLHLCSHSSLVCSPSPRPPHTHTTDNVGHLPYASFLVNFRSNPP